MLSPATTISPILRPYPCATASPKHAALPVLTPLHLKYLAHPKLQLVEGTQQGNGMCANAVTELTLFHGSPQALV